MTELLHAAVQLALGLVFLASTVGKLRAPSAFARGVASYDVLPRALAVPAGYALIPLEAWLAFAHLTGLGLRYGALLGALTLCAFAAGVAVNLRRGRGLPCFCFSARGGELLSARTLARLGLLLAGECLLLADPALWGAAPSLVLFPGRLASAGELAYALLLAAGTLSLGFWVLSLPDLIYMVKGCEACARDAHDLGMGL